MSSLLSFRLNLDGRSLSRIFLKRGSGESKKHILLKILSFLYFYHPRLSIEQRVDQRFKPDLVRCSLEGDVLLWIECGKVKLKKMEQVLKKNPRAELLVVKASPREMQSVHKLAAGHLSNLDRLHFAAFDPTFIRRLSVVLDRHNHLSMALRRSSVEVILNELEEESEVVFLPARSRKFLLSL